MKHVEQGYNPYDKKIQPEKTLIEQVAMDGGKDYLAEMKTEREKLELLQKLEEEERVRVKKRSRKNN